MNKIADVQKPKKEKKKSSKKFPRKEEAVVERGDDGVKYFKNPDLLKTEDEENTPHLS